MVSARENMNRCCAASSWYGASADQSTGPTPQSPPYQHRQLPQPLMPSAPQQLGHARRAADVRRTPQRPQGVPPHDPQLGPLPHESLPYDGIRHRAAVDGRPHHAPQLPGEPDLLGQRRHPTFEPEQTHRDAPAAPLTPDDMLRPRMRPSKKTSLNSLVPVICRMGRTSIRPG